MCPVYSPVFYLYSLAPTCSSVGNALAIVFGVLFGLTLAALVATLVICTLIIIKVSVSYGYVGYTVNLVLFMLKNNIMSCD